MKRTVIIPVLLSCLSIIIIGLNSCAGSQKEIIPSSEFAPYINAYTGGVISQSSPIRIELTQDQPVVDLNNELKENPFRFSPSLKGKAYWVISSGRRSSETRNNVRRLIPIGRIRHCG